MKKVLYAVAVFALLAGVVYAVAVEPRPCGMDDISSACGSGARRGGFIAGVLVALLAGYVGRMLADPRLADAVGLSDESSSDPAHPAQRPAAGAGDPRESNPKIS